MVFLANCIAFSAKILYDICVSMRSMERRLLLGKGWIYGSDQAIRKQWARRYQICGG